VARLELTDIVKRFDAVTAVDRVSFALADGEFLAVLGPSGCGKTTLLRLIAGFELPDGGSIAIDGAEVSGPQRHVPPERRRIGIVFQSYALWPHMTVKRNVGYALEVAGIRGSAYDRRVDAALANVGLTGLGDRRPANLSGGQRQRVALARCLVMEPAIVLLDEPLANLDVHLRASMVEEFAAFHDKTGATMIYITHDQSEAMALADRIAVMDRGHLAQVATPRDLYREPANATVGAFVGNGAIVPIEVISANGHGTADVMFAGAHLKLRCRPGQAGGKAQACLRPEHCEPSDAGAHGAVVAQVSRATYRGGRSEIHAAVLVDPDIVLRLDIDDGRAPRLGETFGIIVRDGWVLPAG
jgi:iron(III) transport system ATP-binding protein